MTFFEIRPLVTQPTEGIYIYIMSGILSMYLIKFSKSNFLKCFDWCPASNYPICDNKRNPIGFSQNGTSLLVYIICRGDRI